MAVRQNQTTILVVFGRRRPFLRRGNLPHPPNPVEGDCGVFDVKSFLRIQSLKLAKFAENGQSYIF
jgi:hypothetical protein